jgi:copper chaperone CopZ
MTCSGCQAKVKGLLSNVPGVSNVTIDISRKEALIDMKTHVATAALKAALMPYPQYPLEEKTGIPPVNLPMQEEAAKSWFGTYKPVILIFGYITGATVLVQFLSGSFNGMEWMRHFMAGFFLVFSFFKLLNLKGFAESYSTYDIIASRWQGWGYIYAFTELALGIAYLLNFSPLVTGIATFVVMSLSIIGVLKAVFNKKKIRCACLGAVFNLPMSTITIIEDALMIMMSAIMVTAML